MPHPADDLLPPDGDGDEPAGRKHLREGAGSQTVLASSVFTPVASDPKGLDPYTWTFVAQYSVSYLEFEYDNASGFDPGYVDNVDVEPVATSVSEPASVWLVLIGLAATVVASRRRRGLVA